MHDDNDSLSTDDEILAREVAGMTLRDLRTVRDVLRGRRLRNAATQKQIEEAIARVRK